MDKLRKCITCGSFKQRKDLIKITKETDSGEIIINPNSKIFGRSVYLCYNQSCIDNAFKKNKINKALKTSANINKSVILDLFNQDLKGTTDGQFKS